MRAIWKGAVTFGLVNVPVKLYSATEDHDIKLHQVHGADGGRIRYQRRCEICGEAVDYADIEKAYDDGERTVILTDEDFDALPVSRGREIDVVEFVPSEQIDPIMLERTYYLEPDSKSLKAYALLRRTLEETDRTAIVQFALRQKTRLGALRVRGDVLVLQGLLWDDEVRAAEFPSLDQRVNLSEKELQMSAALVESFEADFDASRFTDEYQEQLRELIEAKLDQGDALDTDATFGESDDDGDGGGEVLDLMEALRRSVEKSRGGSTKKTTAKKPDAQKAAPKKPAANKPAAKKPAAKKPAAKKTAEKEPAKKAAPKRKAQ